MNYTDIKELALSYSDRSDSAVSAELDGFLRVIEARVNKKLKTQKMGASYSIPAVALQKEYSLPSDFAGLREIVYVNGTSKKTGVLTTPEFLADDEDNPSAVYVNPNNNEFKYAIIADKLRIYPSLPDTGSIDIVYHKHVPPLTAINPDNWLSTYHPDCYAFGLGVEINAWVKDADAMKLWELRFIDSMNDIQTDDARNRWSGTPMTIKLA